MESIAVAYAGVTVLTNLAVSGVHALDSNAGSSYGSESSHTSCSGSLYIEAASETWVGNLTATKFDVEIKGKEPSTGYITRKDESGNGFLQRGFTSFHSLCGGNYGIMVTGYDKFESVFSLESEFRHPGSGDCYCNVLINEKYMRCECR